MPRNRSRVAAASLVLDYGLYPRHETNSQNIRYLVEALQAGAVLPPVVACRSTKRVIDGFHRINALLKYHGPEAMVEVEWRDYQSDAERFADAMRLNAGHGFRLSRWDQAMCMVKAKSLGLPEEQVAAVLSLSAERAREIAINRTALDAQDQPYALKRSLQHLAGQTLTVQQRSYNEVAGGLSQGFYVQQVISMLQSGSEDKGNLTLETALQKLYALLAARYP